VNILTSSPFAAIAPSVTFVRMAEDKKRNWVKITDDTKRKLTHLSVEAGAASVEEFAGDLLARAVEDLWQRFDPKRNDPPKRRSK
jgi:hypothetical protein